MWRATHDRPPNPSNLETSVIRSSQSVGFSNTKFRKVSKAIMRNLPANGIIESCCVAGPGYVNVILSKQWMAQSLHTMLIDGIDTWAPKLPVKRAIFPNGEFNDQAIGELELQLQLSRIQNAFLRFHFCECYWMMNYSYLDSIVTSTGVLQGVQEAMVSLQGGDERYLKAWAQICEISRKGFEQVYERLDVHLEEK
nr:hypothetical protein [Tanacetum cinerariifolium]